MAGSIVQIVVKLGQERGWVRITISQSQLVTSVLEKGQYGKHCALLLSLRSPSLSRSHCVTPLKTHPCLQTLGEIQLVSIFKL